MSAPTYRLHGVDTEIAGPHPRQVTLRILVGKSDRFVPIPLTRVQLAKLNEECAKALKQGLIADALAAS